ncbi:lipid storage droplets surface binding protein 2 (lsd2) [Anopheles darlingi]|uniref:Lipid storage droplets surface binding protein 2 (Lsd2) n=1 Tax=Anopheles darlingi TaxID=43151 RepID=W5JVS9_ANODA|nr:lipid storage droplets surface binding protein 2 (lsd2) [Anopheles darlingi]
MSTSGAAKNGSAVASNGTQQHHASNEPAAAAADSAVNNGSSVHALLPHLESIDRMMGLPVVDATWQQTQMVYGRVKDSNRLLTWALGMVEDVVCRAATVSAPLVHRLDRPLQLVDQTLVRGIDRLEVNAPILKEQPAEIYQQARTRVLETMKPHLERVCELRSASQQRAATLKELSWRKANEVLATQYGCLAVDGIDTTASVAERLLDYYFPKREDESDDDNAPVGAKEDPVLHTVQTVGRLSNKVARRVYRTVSQRVKSLGLQDVRDYVATLIAVLRLTQYLNFINEKPLMVEEDTSSTNNHESRAVANSSPSFISSPTTGSSASNSEVSNTTSRTAITDNSDASTTSEATGTDEKASKKKIVM